VKHVLFIEPGVYRLQKSWERVAAQAAGPLGPGDSPGLLAELGLTIREVSSVITVQDHAQETTAGPAQANRGQGQGQGATGINGPPGMPRN
jgi:hypothetical protein